MTRPVLYSQPTCMPCRFVKDWFERKNIEIEVKDVTTNEDYVSELRELGYHQTPVLTHNGRTLYGFLPDVLEQWFPA